MIKRVDSIFTYICACLFVGTNIPSMNYYWEKAD